MQKKEAKLTSEFNKRLRAKGLTGAFELKQATTSLPFNRLAEHQENALLAVKRGSFVFKIPDVGFFNPFDVFSLSKTDAFVVCYFPRVFYCIDIDVFIQCRETCGRKSLTKDMAQKIATYLM